VLFRRPKVLVTHHNLPCFCRNTGVAQQKFLSELFEQGVNLSVLELNDLLLMLVHHATERGEQHVPRLEQERHVRRRTSLVSNADG